MAAAVGNSSSSSSLPDYWIECDYNWTGPVLGESGFGDGTGEAGGFIAVLIACILFGSMFVPFKFIKTGDGIFTQWVMCCSIWLCGLAMQLIRQQPVFFLETLAGGAMWTIGNCCAVPIIHLIGMSIGMLVWNCSNVLLGWASGRFGFFGLCPQIPNVESLNYAGVVLCVLAGGVYVLVKTEPKVDFPQCLRKIPCIASAAASSSAETSTEAADIEMTTNDASVVAVGVDASVTTTTKSADNLVAEVAPDSPVFLAQLSSPMARRILGTVLALAAGCCFAVQFLPSIYVQNHTIYEGARASQNGLDYVFSQFCGILLTSTTIFAGYMIINWKSAFVDKSIVLPALLSGIMWGIATICVFLANSVLSAAITFPLTATLPGMVATLWGIFFFGEIKGLRNFIILSVAFTLTIVGAVLTALSKVL